MLITPFQALYPNVQRLGDATDALDTAKERFDELLQADLFLSTVQPAFFLYEITTNRRQYRGLLACTDIAAYRAGQIKKHEATLPAEERKQMQLTLARRAAVKPVLLVYPDAAGIEAWMVQYLQQNPPFLEVHFDKDQQTHRLWQVQEPADIEALQQLFAHEVGHAYIADGHHRMAAMALLAESDAATAAYRQVYCAFFPAGELDILEFNRVVAVPVDFRVEYLAKLFDIQPLSAPAKPLAPHQLTLCTPQGWFELQWKASVLQTFSNQPVIIDTALLNEKVLRDLLHITDIRHDRRVQYLDAPKGLAAVAQKVQEQPSCIGFCLYPVSFPDLRTLVEAGSTLPPKSTWFEPRMKNGLLVKPY